MGLIMIPTHKDHSIPVIYLITNTVNDRIYVGSATTFYGRYRVYKYHATPGNDPRRYIQRAMQKHGFDSFVFSILERVSDKRDLIEREQYWIDQLRPYDKAIGYNVNPVADSWLGRKHSEETKRKISEKKRGKPLSEQHKKRSQVILAKLAIDNMRSVTQIDATTLRPIATFDSIRNASKITGIGPRNIGIACSGHQGRSAYSRGFLWCYTEDIGKRDLSRKRRIAYRRVMTLYPVNRLDDNDVLVDQWPNGFDAAKGCGVDPKTIYRSIVDKCAISGQRWQSELDDRAYES